MSEADADAHLAHEIRQRIALKMDVQVKAFVAGLGGRENRLGDYSDPASIGVVVGDNLVLVKHRLESGLLQSWMYTATSETMEELGVVLWHIL